MATKSQMTSLISNSIRFTRLGSNDGSYPGSRVGDGCVKLLRPGSGCAAIPTRIWRRQSFTLRLSIIAKLVRRLCLGLWRFIGIKSENATSLKTLIPHFPQTLELTGPPNLG